MAENTNIEWCDHTFNPWTGCTKVSPGCANCYAEGWSKRSGIVTWGKGQPRKRTSEANWKQPLKWNQDAEFFHECTACHHRAVMVDGCTICGCDIVPARPRIFCASLADWLDDEVPVEWLSDLIYLICKCNHLDWLLLTKRPQLWLSRLQAVANGSDLGAIICTQWLAGNPPPNVWIGTTVENQEMADERIPHLLDIPARIHFLSCEPLLGFTDIQPVGDDDLTIYWPLVGKAISDGMNEPLALKNGRIDWVICGGESGPNARPMHPNWPRALRDMCQQAGVPFLFKQWGEWRHADSPQHGLVIFRGGTPKVRQIPGDPLMFYKVGKKAAGRQLDGREWNEFPRPL